MYLEKFRAELLDDLSAKAGSVDRKELWDATSPTVVGARLRGLKAISPVDYELAIAAESMESVELAEALANQSILSCPLQPRAYLQRARLSQLFGARRAALADLKRCLLVAPVHPQMHAASATIAISLGEAEEARDWLIRGLELGMPLDAQVGDMIVSKWNPSGIIPDMKSNDALMQLFRHKSFVGIWQEAAGNRIVEAWGRMSSKELLRETDFRLGCFAATVLKARKADQASLDCYRRVFEGRELPEFVSHRFTYARQLIAAGHPADAVHQLNICCRQSNNSRYAAERAALLKRHIRPAITD
ncbi:MAG: hypothetical protein AAF497_15025 [Planctomycetota bacterium]